MLRKYFIVIIFFISGCIDPINFKFKDQVQHLVVEAKFTNLPGPHIIRLSLSQPFTSRYKQFVKNANVYITSAEGEFYQFDYDPNTLTYINNHSKGEIGHTYTLHVVTQDEKTYQSQPITLRDVVPVDSIRVKYGEITAKEKGEGGRILPGYYFSVDYTDPGDQRNYYRWSYEAHYEVRTQPHEFVDYCCIPPVPRPKSCCAQCWINEAGSLIIVRKDDLTNGRKVLDEQLFFLPFERYMNNKLKLTVIQHSITEEAFDFFTEMEKQRNSTGSVFDPPPTQIQGNIFNLNDNTDQVIGYFDASSVSVKEITLVSNQIPYNIQRFEYPDDCREIENASVYPPANW